MSLLIGVTFGEYGVIASDGLAVNIEEGSTVPTQTQDDYCKFWTVTNGIAVGSIGHALKNQMLHTFSDEFAERYREDSKLFSILEETIPIGVRCFNKWLPVTECIELPEYQRFTITPLLLGYDQSQDVIRMVRWKEDLTPEHCGIGEISIMGLQRVAECAGEKLSNKELSVYSPNLVEEEISAVILEVAEKFPKFVGGQIFTQVITKPDPGDQLCQ